MSGPKIREALPSRNSAGEGVVTSRGRSCSPQTSHATAKAAWRDPLGDLLYPRKRKEGPQPLSERRASHIRLAAPLRLRDVIGER